MAKYRVTSPDGATFEVTAPDSATEAEVMAYAQGEFAKQLPSISKPAVVSAGEAIRDVPRQLGLTARYALEGAPAALDVVASPFRAGLTAVGLPVPTLQQAGSTLADTFGLPKPASATERVVGDAARTMAGAAGMTGLAGATSRALSGVPAKVAEFLAANPTQQTVAAASAGGAGGAVREAGGGPVEQAVGATIGGVAGGLGAAGIEGLGKALMRAVTPKMTAQEVEQRIDLVLRSSGVDWAQVPQNIKAGLRQEVAQALRTGDDLSGDALRRLIDFRATGTTPTRGMLTQNPSQITREMNLAKTGANSADIGLQRLPAIQNANTSQLLNVLDNAGARNAPDAYATGQRVVNALGSNIGAAKQTINALYSAARDNAGRSAELDGAAFTRTANQALDEAMLGYAVPQSVANRLNQIARGEVPFTVDFAEQLKTNIGQIGAAGKGDATTRAMGVIRRALDATPLRPAAQVNPGNLPAVPGTVPPSPAVLGEEAIQAFNRARQANRGLMQRVERSPAIDEVFTAMREGGRVDPDKFVQKFIIGGGASANDVRELRRAIANDPAALESTRQSIVAHLKSAATNGTDDVVKFSSAAYNHALNNIGERKLAAFFSPEQIAELRSVGRAATLMQAQPTGSAVNNSNSGALLLGRGLDMLDTVVGKMPLGIDNMLQGTIRGVQQRNALNVPQALISPTSSENQLARIMGVPMLYGLLASQPVNNQ